MALVDNTEIHLLLEGSLSSRVSNPKNTLLEIGSAELHDALCEALCGVLSKSVSDYVEEVCGVTDLGDRTAVSEIVLYETDAFVDVEGYRTDGSRVQRLVFKFKGSELKKDSLLSRMERINMGDVYFLVDDSNGLYTVSLHEHGELPSGSAAFDAEVVDKLHALFGGRVVDWGVTELTSVGSESSSSVTPVDFESVLNDRLGSWWSGVASSGQGVSGSQFVLTVAEEGTYNLETSLVVGGKDVSFTNYHNAMLLLLRDDPLYEHILGFFEGVVSAEVVCMGVVSAPSAYKLSFAGFEDGSHSLVLSGR